MTGRGGPQHIPRPADTLPGGPPPWAGLDPERRQVWVDDVRRAVEAVGEPRTIPEAPPGARPSAVLIPVYESEAGAEVVLTRRAWNLRMHKGEVSFPGGRREPGETDHETALREAWEETGLERDQVEVIGELDHLATFSSTSLIVPYVGILKGRPDLTPHEAEVEAILHVPLSELLLDEVYREEKWWFGDAYRSLHFFELVGDTVWGATARILYQLLGLVTGTAR